MDKEEFTKLLIKTIFCCMTSDGKVEQQELDFFYSICKKYFNIDSIEDFEEEINRLTIEVNKKGNKFITEHIEYLQSIELLEDEKYLMADYILQIISADRKIDYCEVRFFKEIIKVLNLSKETILNKFPNIDKVLLEEDINVPIISFNNMLFSKMEFMEFPDIKQIRISDIHRNE